MARTTDGLGLKRLLSYLALLLLSLLSCPAPQKEALSTCTGARQGWAWGEGLPARQLHPCAPC